MEVHHLLYFIISSCQNILLSNIVLLQLPQEMTLIGLPVSSLVWLGFSYQRDFDGFSLPDFQRKLGRIICGIVFLPKKNPSLLGCPAGT